ncbi:MAG: twin-arginine translocase TatA/TatE family subunit [Methylovirgula sp.]|jgi:sec-independent protein translocase protein TatB
MFEFDAGKFIIIGIVALIVIGPKELPRVMRQLGQVLAKLRRLSSDFQAQFMEAIREADLEDVKAEAAKIAEATKLDTTKFNIDPLAGIRSDLMKPIAASSAATDASPLPAQSDPLGQALKADQPAVVRTIECREAAPEGFSPDSTIANSQDELDDLAAVEAQGPAADVDDVEPLRKRL